jgi:hypothetical protein
MTRVRRSVWRVALVIGCAVAGRPCLCRSQVVVSATTGSYRARLLGVYDATSGTPVEGARVVDMVGHVTALTTATGTVSLAFLPEGASLVRIEKIGLQPTTVSVQISPNDTVPITILLQPLVHDLPAVVTRDSNPQYDTPALRRFEERRLSRASHGYFISEMELQKHPTSVMSDMIRRFPGLSVVCPMRGNKCWANSTRAIAMGSGHCKVAVYVDGVPAEDLNLRGLSATEYAGVEFYPGGASVPPQFNQTALTCGVLLFWSRER